MKLDLSVLNERASVTDKRTYQGMGLRDPCQLGLRQDGYHSRLAGPYMARGIRCPSEASNQSEPSSSTRALARQPSSAERSPPCPRQRPYRMNAMNLRVSACFLSGELCCVAISG